MLVSRTEVERLLAAGKSLVIAGDEALLRTLPRGNWIGGTIPYFMTEEGGVTTRARLYVEPAPTLATHCTVRTYNEQEIREIGRHSPDHGYTVLIVPAFSALHESYALSAASYPDLFFKVIAGWIAGVHLDDLGRHVPTVFCGQTGESSSTRGVAMHVHLPREYAASLATVNIFEAGDGPAITFPTSGFSAKYCLVDGERTNFHDYLVRENLDPRLPLIADFCGAMVNVSIKALNADAHRVSLYAPVFEGVQYRLARPLDNYAARFDASIPRHVRDTAFSCNCVLNYQYGNLEGRHTGRITGPMTFGEIGYQLLNQTMVYVTVERQAA